MTHTQTQGADGAGTFARFGHHPDPSTDFCIEVDALQGWAVDMRAGLRSQWPYWSRLSKLLRFVHSPEMAALDSIAQAALPAVSNLEGAAFDAPAHATPAPAATPGVPDSLRALSEAASEDWATNDATPYILGPQIDGEHDRFEVIARGPHGHAKSGDAIRKWQANRMFAVAAVNHVRALIAAQPAGQAGDPSCDFQMMLARLISRHSKGLDITQTIEGARDLLKRKGTLSPLREEPAPNSTRTGAAETEEAVEAAASEREALRKAVSNALHDNQFLDGWPEMVDPVVEAVLAARPEAPSDAGWRERVRHVKRGTEYEVLGEAEAQIATRSTCPDGPGNGVLPNSSILHEGDKLTVYRGSDGNLWLRFTDEFRDGRFETITPPSDPAPSGQAEG